MIYVNQNRDGEPKIGSPFIKIANYPLAAAYFSATLFQLITFQKAAI